MLETENGPQTAADSSTQEATQGGTARVRRSRRAASRPAGPPNTPTLPSDPQAPDPTGDGASGPAAETKQSAKAPKTTKKIAAKKTAKTKATTQKKSATKKSTAKKPSAKKPSKKAVDTAATPLSNSDPAQASSAEQRASVAVLFQPPDPVKATKHPVAGDSVSEPAGEDSRDPMGATDATQGQQDSEPEGATRRRRRRGGRRRRKESDDATTSTDEVAEDTTGKAGQPASPTVGEPTDESSAEPGSDEASGGGGPAESSSTASRRRRRRRKRADEDAESSGDDPTDTVVHVRTPRASNGEITGLDGSTRLEAKKQRRREGRAAGRRRTPIVSEAEFLARRESVERVMVVRQRGDVTQIAVVEDKVLVEHYVSRESQTSLIGNVYLGRVQNVLPSMEAAFIDVGKGRNGVLYAGEVNWDLIGQQGESRRIESVLKSGQPVLVQVSKDPVGHKGARLTSQISLPGRFLVYVPGGGGNGISRKLPETERTRLKSILKEILPDEAGVIIRTAAEGASEEELTRDVNRLTARWEDIEKKAAAGNAPQLLYGEPDLTIKAVRDLFTEDFGKLVVSGDDAWDTVHGYVSHVAPELTDRLERWEADEDVFASYRIDEQIAKALDRKVFLPSGGSVVIDRTEAMTVVDVNTGKFTGSGGNLEETVTKNNLEAAEEIVRQLRLRDIGGIIVIDFIDMVLESNRDLVLRRLVECLGRDRTRHQVAEVTSLGLVQMTRKRIGTGLLEAFSRPCENCGGRGVIVEHEPISPDLAKASKKRTASDKEKAGKSGKTAKKSSAKKSKSTAIIEEPRQPDAENIEGPGSDSVDESAGPAGGRSARSLLDRDEDDLPAAVTPRKRTRKRATRPAGQPTPAS
jgi:ribonuclease E